MSKRRTRRAILGSLRDDAEPLFRAAARREGLTYHEWCQAAGVIDEAALRKIERHETPAQHTDMWPFLRRLREEGPRLWPSLH